MPLRLAARANGFWTVTRKYGVLRASDKRTPTPFTIMGSKVMRRAAVPFEMRRGDELHNLVGGTFVVRGGRVVAELTSTQPPSFSSNHEPIVALPVGLLKPLAKATKIERYR